MIFSNIGRKIQSCQTLNILFVNTNENILPIILKKYEDHIKLFYAMSVAYNLTQKYMNKLNTHKHNTCSQIFHECGKHLGRINKQAFTYLLVNYIKKYNLVPPKSLMTSFFSTLNITNVTSDLVPFPFFLWIPPMSLEFSMAI